MKYYYPERLAYTKSQCFRKALELKAEFFIHRDDLYKIEKQHPLGFVRVMSVEEFVDHLNDSVIQEAFSIINGNGSRD